MAWLQHIIFLLLFVWLVVVQLQDPALLLSGRKHNMWAERRKTPGSFLGHNSFYSRTLLWVSFCLFSTDVCVGVFSHSSESVGVSVLWCFWAEAAGCSRTVLLKEDDLCLCNVSRVLTVCSRSWRLVCVPADWNWLHNVSRHGMSSSSSSCKQMFPLWTETLQTCDHQLWGILMAGKCIIRAFFSVCGLGSLKY